MVHFGRVLGHRAGVLFCMEWISGLAWLADATPWQRIYRKTVNSLAEGATLEGATEFRQIAKNPPRHNH